MLQISVFSQVNDLVTWRQSNNDSKGRSGPDKPSTVLAVRMVRGLVCWAGLKQVSREASTAYKLGWARNQGIRARRGPLSFKVSG